MKIISTREKILSLIISLLSMFMIVSSLMLQVEWFIFISVFFVAVAIELDRRLIRKIVKNAI